MTSFKRIISLGCALAILLTLGVSGAAAKPDFTLDEEWAVLEIVNDERKAQGLQGLSTFAALDVAAVLRTGEILTTFSHTRPDGSSFFTALEGISFGSAGENIAAGYSNPDWVMEGWMNSPGHRANILTEGFKHIGVGYTAGGDYGHYWTQLFVGGCQSESITLADTVPLFSADGQLLTADSVLKVQCNMHGDSYIPLAQVDYHCNATGYGNATVTVEYDGVSTDLPCQIGFTDVVEGKWYYDAVHTAVNNGWFNGTSATTFSPDGEMTRAMIVTVLYRMEGAPAVGSDTAFTDLTAGWYKDAIAWAAENGIVEGVGEGRFAPNTAVSRQQIATILYRYSEFKGQDISAVGELATFADGTAVSDYAVGAMRWAVGEGLIQGKTGNLLDPKGSATRAQVATILTRYAQ